MLFRQAGNTVCVKSRIHKNVPQLHHYKLEDNCVKNAGNPLSHRNNSMEGFSTQNQQRKFFTHIQSATRKGLKQPQGTASTNRMRKGSREKLQTARCERFSFLRKTVRVFFATVCCWLSRLYSATVPLSKHTPT